MARPLLDLFCITEEGCKYPVAVKVLMDDNTVQTYTLDCKDDMRFEKVMDSLKKMTVGYEYKPRRKNRIRSGIRTR